MYFWKLLGDVHSAGPNMSKIGMPLVVEMTHVVFVELCSGVAKPGPTRALARAMLGRAQAIIFIILKI